MGRPVGQGRPALRSVNAPPQIFVVADDLTGACDAASPFASMGLTVVTWQLSGGLAADVLAVSTGSRHLAAVEAATRNREAVQRAGALWGAPGPTWIYKKIDSTLRGHPGAELGAIMAALDISRALVAPAFPAQGRTTVGGRQLVDGRPLEETAFGRDVESSDVAALFRRWARNAPLRRIALETVRSGAGAICQALKAAGPALFVADAETETDLAALAQGVRASNLRLLCGSAGLSRALGQALKLATAVAGPDLPVPPRAPVLVIAGSRHPSTLRQVEAARQQGAAVVQARDAVLSMAGEPTPGLTVEHAAAHLAGGRDVVLATGGLEESPLGALDVARRLGQLAAALLARGQVGGLVLTGGDTALAACLAMDSRALWLQGEIEPGIAVGRLLGSRWPGLPVITKAGGFGTDQALVLAINRLHSG